MTSSVAAGRRRYSMRISCCLASSRETTTMLFGRPICPVSKRRITALPREPVPPVTRTRFPSRTTGTPPRFVRCGITGHSLDHRWPRWRNIPDHRPEAVRIEAPVKVVIGKRFNLNGNPKRLAHQAKQVVLADRLGGDVVHAGEIRVSFNHVGHETGEGSCGKSGENHVSKSLHASPAVTQEPFYQAVAVLRLAADEGSTERQTSRAGDLTQELGSIIEILGIHPLTAGEHTVSAYVDQSGAGGLAEASEAVREQGIDRDAGYGVLRSRQLLDDADGVDDDIRLCYFKRSHNRIEVRRINTTEQPVSIKEIVPGVFLIARTDGPPRFEPVSKNLPQLVTKHAGGAKDQDPHSDSRF